ncbi:unnamed protein product [Ilex paraguariensis]|uniref:GDSL esterase/lipase n=1 Tax=Ilex paraguariensis TaxID=185542 RepID=A0ABC8S7P7_9AQUA
MFTRALVFLGEIGGNDINYSLQEGKSIQEVYSYLPYMTEVISNAVREVIHLGAVNIVVPGNFPMGCFPIFLTKFSCGDPTTYDDMGCLRDLNELVLAQNNFLQEALALLRLEFPHVVIIYADYYTSFQTILRRAPDFGFNEQSLLQACCGIGGIHNYDEERACGHPDVPVCHNPVQYISWDGIHLTQDAYRHITAILIHDILPGTMGSPMTMEA